MILNWTLAAAAGLAAILVCSCSLGDARTRALGCEIADSWELDGDDALRVALLKRHGRTQKISCRIRQKIAVFRTCPSLAPRRQAGLENMDGAGASNWVRNKHGSALVQKTLSTSVGWLFSWADLG